MPYKSTQYFCKDCDKIGYTKSKTSNGICRSCFAKRNLKIIKDKGIIGRRLKPFEHIYRSLIRNAKKSSRLVCLSFESFLEFTNIEECHYCRAPIEWKPYHGNANYYLDRMDNSMDYHKNNLVVCCPDCNRIKGSDFTYLEFKKIALFIKEIRK